MEKINQTNNEMIRKLYVDSVRKNGKNLSVVLRNTETEYIEFPYSKKLETAICRALDVSELQNAIDKKILAFVSGHDRALNLIAFNLKSQLYCDKSTCFFDIPFESKDWCMFSNGKNATLCDIVIMCKLKDMT